MSARPLGVPYRRTGQAAAGTDLYQDSTRIVSTTSSSSANLIVELIWRVQVAGRCLLLRHPVPVRLLSNGVRGARSCWRDRNSWNSPNMESIELE